MIGVEDWAEIRRLHRAEGLSARAVARQLGISRGTVARALASDRPPVYQRPLKGSAVDTFEPALRELLQQTPTMPATVIAERIGWTRGLTILKERVRELRPAYLPVDPVREPSTSRASWPSATCGPAVDIPLGYGQSGRPPVLVMVSGDAMTGFCTTSFRARRERATTVGNGGELVADDDRVGGLQGEVGTGPGPWRCRCGRRPRTNPRSSPRGS